MLSVTPEEAQEGRKAVASFWTRDYAGIVCVDLRYINGFDGPGLTLDVKVILTPACIFH